ncbi:aminopeptidase P family protein [Acidiferrimicrobium sp. IK]|uniref:aminopeptidase P family protein n=1 Tax=Acidiferrimicrobium sp. IK TaxID=2871700 RepID=UPI0021CB762B|nr:aminopeptidase P family protein [Acidiferrimicrobium sp. IK]MCU4184814.1 aminopeptidase P family protein [Acidiferrimicrobium sp. IK]
MTLTPVAELTPMDTAGRLGRLRDRLGDAGVDGLVVTSLTNIRYLSGFTGSAGMLLVLPGATVLVTDGRYGTQAPEQIAAAGVDARCEVAPAPDQRAVAAGLVGSTAARLGLEAAHVSWARQRAFAETWWPDVELVATVGVVEELRKVKDPGELARLAGAAAIADRALAAVRPMLAEGPREIDFAHALDAEMRRLGAAGPSFETIVASGPNGAMPHHRPGARRIERGEPVVIDFGALLDGYCSDMTRTVWDGPLADPVLRRAVEVVAESQAAGVAAVSAGVAAADVDRACREVIAAAGWADAFVHGTGHGVGLDIHEAPSVAASSGDTLAPGHVVTVEPGVYLPGIGGVRIEDTVVVTDEGCTPLTSTAKDLP